MQEIIINYKPIEKKLGINCFGCDKYIEVIVYQEGYNIFNCPACGHTHNYNYIKNNLHVY